MLECRWIEVLQLKHAHLVIFKLKMNTLISKIVHLSYWLQHIHRQPVIIRNMINRVERIYACRVVMKQIYL